MINHDYTQETLLFPGLNMSPQALNDLAYIEAGKIIAHRYELDSNHWERDFFNTIETYSPKKIIAHSLGAILTLKALIDLQKDIPARLICPPLSLKFGPFLFSKLVILLPKNFKIPSANLPSYRVNPYTTVRDYLELFRLIRYVKKNLHKLKNPKNIKIIVVSDDELVDSKAIEKFSAFEVIELKKATNLGAKHLFIDRASCGEHPFNALLELL